MPAGYLAMIPVILSAHLFKKNIAQLDQYPRLSATILATTSLLYLTPLTKVFHTVLKTCKAGLNYKQHLQNILTNLDAIDAHIAQAKA